MPANGALGPEGQRLYLVTFEMDYTSIFAVASLLLSLLKSEFQLHRNMGVREVILLGGGAEKFAMKITICPETNLFSLIRIGPETSCKSVLYS